MSSKKFVSFGPWLFLHLHWETVHSGYGQFRTFLKLELDFLVLYELNINTPKVKK